MRPIAVVSPTASAAARSACSSTISYTAAAPSSAPTMSSGDLARRDDAAPRALDRVRRAEVRVRHVGEAGRSSSRRDARSRRARRRACESHRRRSRRLPVSTATAPPLRISRSSLTGPTTRACASTRAQSRPRCSAAPATSSASSATSRRHASAFAWNRAAASVRQSVPAATPYGASGDLREAADRIGELPLHGREDLKGLRGVGPAREGHAVHTRRQAAHSAPASETPGRSRLQRALCRNRREGRRMYP